MKYKVNPEEALRQYADMVYRIAYTQTKQKTDAEDIFQEVFLRLMRYADRIKDEEHLKAWLIKVTISQCKRHFTSTWRKKVVPLYNDEQVTESYEMKEESPVVDAMRQLASDYKSVLHLFYYEQYSVKEIGSLLSISESLVKTRLSRGRQKLKELLKGEVEDGISI